jgi:urease accessory protein
MNTNTELLRLLTWLSPAFPTGGFAYSHGLEWAVEAGGVSNETILKDWLIDILRYGSGWTDAILLRHAHRTPNKAALQNLCELGAAIAPAKERRSETLAQGEAFTRAAQPWRIEQTTIPQGPVPYPIAVGALAAEHGISEDAATSGYLQAITTNLISAAVRLIPLGQTAGLRVVAALEDTIVTVASETATATLDDLGGACFHCDIAAMRHETQHTRLFRT